MRKILLICQVEFRDESDGVLKKVKAQIVAFQQLGFEVDVLCYSNGYPSIRQYINDKEYNEIVLDNYSGKFRRFLFWKSANSFIKENEYYMAYIRYSFIDFSVLRTLKNLKRMKTKIIIEIPSIKTNISMFSGVTALQYLFDKAINKRCAKYVDKVLYVGDIKEKALGCVAYPIVNGIPYGFDNILKTGCNMKESTIQLLTVSTMGISRGFERIVCGLVDYYKDNTCNRRIELTMVGEGECVPILKKIVEDNNLQEYVTFKNRLYGIELDEEFKKATIGIGALGLFHLGAETASTLKVKEYFLRGLPFIYSGTEIAVPENYPFALKFPNDATPIECKKIIDFVDNLEDYTSQEIIQEMNSFAKEKFNWKSILEDACKEFL